MELPITNRIETKNNIAYVVHCNNQNCTGILRTKQAFGSEQQALLAWNIMIVEIQKNILQRITRKRNV
jgi:hypothetical protein